MELRISGASGNDQAKLRAAVRGRMIATLGRFGSRIRRVRISLSDQNGPRGGVDKLCRAEAYLLPTGVLVAEVLDTDFEPAVHRAAQRLARRIRDHLSRIRATRRGRFSLPRNRVLP